MYCRGETALARLAWPLFAGCCWKRISRCDDVSAQECLRKIPPIQRDQKICFPIFCTNAKHVISGIGRYRQRSGGVYLFGFFLQQIDDAADQSLADAQSRKHSFVFVKISSETSHVNVFRSNQWRINCALGLAADLSERNPAIPATSTDVSITPLGRFFFCAGNDGDLRQLFSFRTVFPDGVCYLRFRNV